jgi:hypothetical protein
MWEERKKERKKEDRKEGKKENMMRLEQIYKLQSEFCRMLFKSQHVTASSDRQYNVQFTELHIFISEDISHKLLWNPPSLPYTIRAGFLGIEENSLFQTRVLRSVGNDKKYTHIRRD